MLSRIYGTAFFKQADLEEHERLLDEARERDHRRLGRELGLFMLREESPGMPFWLPQGTVLLRLIQREVDAQLESAATTRSRRHTSWTSSFGTAPATTTTTARTCTSPTSTTASSL